MMLVVWLLLMVVVTILTHRWIKPLLQQKRVRLVQLIVTISCVIQFIIIYFVVNEIVHYLVKGLNVFYHE